MNRTTALFLSTALLSAACMAQSSANTQAGAAASQTAVVSAHTSGVQVNSSASTDASQQTRGSGRYGDEQTVSSGRLQSGTTVQAELTKPVDARRNKPGDEVTAKTTQDVKSDGKVVLPKGSKIVGKVTQAQARSKGKNESQLGIVFDHAILRDGTPLPVSFAIQAISSSQAEASAAMGDDFPTMEGSTGSVRTASSPGSGRGLVGGVASSAGGVVTTADSAAGATLHTSNAASTSIAGGLTPTSRGAVGMPGLTLSPVASSTTTAGSVISSSNSNVRLASGTRMLLRVGRQMP